ncbi:MAG: ThiF family adenylyltransferase [Candidatus Parabeggiatoa sp. nov. 3]|nr:MAG: ThiF family adenylyltransferase [Gammaproteobacteria bacterium]RKZ67611.1 MAG: ThiF family adenylyltransferase [Gammaproteobacteria bacterium]RKZ88281.1 MAG: ThiF family adenylyltransferase [Gammaproteobacteria bacterium]
MVFGFIARSAIAIFFEITPIDLNGGQHKHVTHPTLILLVGNKNTLPTLHKSINGENRMSVNERFARQTLIAGWEQERLQAATAVIVGIGALGNEVARILALSGIGHLILCDHDTVALSNLSRCVLFREADVGQLKVTVAAQSLKAFGPQLQVQTRPKPLISGIGLAELRSADIVLGCLDSRAARLQLAGRCNLVGAPYIDGGTHPWGGEVRPYLVANGPCYGCSLNSEERSISDVPWSCVEESLSNPVGSTASSSVVIGGWMSLVAIRFLMDLSTPEGSLRIDGSRGTSRIVQQQHNPDCLLHQPIETIKKVANSDQSTVAALLAEIETESVVLSWAPIQQRIECRTCGFQTVRWGIPKAARCPTCETTLRLRTTLELSEAPGQLKLTDLGIAPREILAIRTIKGIEWIELSD